MLPLPPSLPPSVPVRALSAWQAFLLGALSRALATLIIFPWIRVRKMLMAQGKGVREGEEGGREGGKEATVLFTLQKTLRDEGVPGLYRGQDVLSPLPILSARLESSESSLPRVLPPYSPVSPLFPPPLGPFRHGARAHPRGAFCGLNAHDQRAAL